MEVMQRCCLHAANDDDDDDCRSNINPLHPCSNTIHMYRSVSRHCSEENGAAMMSVDDGNYHHDEPSKTHSLTQPRHHASYHRARDSHLPARLMIQPVANRTQSHTPSERAAREFQQLTLGRSRHLHALIFTQLPRTAPITPTHTPLPPRSTHDVRGVARIANLAKRRSSFV